MAGSASVSASDMNRNAEETMRLAIARFRSRMTVANQKFLQDRLKEIEEKGLATEEEKREQLRQYKYMDDVKWDDEDPEMCGSGSIIRIPPQTPVKDLDIPAILNALPSYAPVDGVQPPLLRSDQWRQMYLDTVQRVCQQQVDAIVAEDDEDRDVACTWHKDHRPMTIPPCDELALFLKYAQGVADVDRLSGIATFTPAWSIGARDEELEGLDERQRRDKLADPEPLKCEQEQLQRLLEYELEDKTLRAFIDDDLDVRAGFIADIGFHKWHACIAWYCAYVYCRLMTDDDEDENKHKDEDIRDAANTREWGWRVVFSKAEVNNPTPLYGRKARFDAIPEFLDWYASWLDHLDARALLSLRRHAVACETDCESDCEDH